MAQIRAELRRGVRLAVQEAHHERKRRKEEDVNGPPRRSCLQESTATVFLDSLRQPRNGPDQAELFATDEYLPRPAPNPVQ